MKTEPITLTGQTVRLEPLAMAHRDELCRAALREQVARWMTFPLRGPEDVDRFIADDWRLKRRERRSRLPRWSSQVEW